jgi:hypothetical protein
MRYIELWFYSYLSYYWNKTKQKFIAFPQSIRNMNPVFSPRSNPAFS